VPLICVQSKELHTGGLFIVAIWYSTNYNHERCIWQLREVTSCYSDLVVSQIHCRSLVVSSSLYSPILNIICTCLERHLHPRLQNPFGNLTLSDGSQGSKDPKNSSTALSKSRGPSPNCFKWICPRILDRCFILRNPAAHCLFHLLNIQKLDCRILLANCFKENSVWFKLIRAWTSASPKSDESSFSASALNSS